MMSTYDKIKMEGKMENQTKVIVNGFKNGATIELLALQTELSTDEVIAILKNEGLM